MQYSIGSQKGQGYCPKIPRVLSYKNKKISEENTDSQAFYSFIEEPQITINQKPTNTSQQTQNFQNQQIITPSKSKNSIPKYSNTKANHQNISNHKKNELKDTNKSRLSNSTSKAVKRQKQQSNQCTDENKNLMNVNGCQNNRKKNGTSSENMRIKDLKPKILYQKSTSDLSSREKKEKKILGSQIRSMINSENKSTREKLKDKDIKNQQKSEKRKLEGSRRSQGSRKSVGKEKETIKNNENKEIKSKLVTGKNIRSFLNKQTNLTHKKYETPSHCNHPIKQKTSHLLKDNKNTSKLCFSESQPKAKLASKNRLNENKSATDNKNDYKYKYQTYKNKLNTSTKSLKTFANAKIYGNHFPADKQHLTGVKIRDRVANLSICNKSVNLTIENTILGTSTNNKNRDELLDLLLYGEQKHFEVDGHKACHEPSYVSESSQEMLLQNDCYMSASTPLVNTGFYHNSFLDSYTVLNSLNEESKQKSAKKFQMKKQEITNVEFQTSIQDESLFQGCFSKQKKELFDSRTNGLLQIEIVEMQEKSYLKLVLEHCAVSQILLNGDNNQEKMLAYLSIKQTILYQRITQNLRQHPKNIIALYASIQKSLNQELQYHLRQYLFTKGIIFNRNELKTFVEHFENLSKAIGFDFQSNRQVSYFLQILFFTQSVDSEKLQSLQFEDVFISESMKNQLISKIHNRIVSFWDLLVILQQIDTNNRSSISLAKNCDQSLTNSRFSLYEIQSVNSFLNTSTPSPLHHENQHLLEQMMSWIQKLLPSEH